MINRFALSLLCIELDRNVRFGVTLLYILLIGIHIGYWNMLSFAGTEITLGNFFTTIMNIEKITNYEQIELFNQ